MDSDTSRMTGSLLLLLSLLLHIVILFLLFIFQDPLRDAPHIEYFNPDVQLFDPQSNQPTQPQQPQDPQQQAQQQTKQDDTTIDLDHEIMIDLLSQGIEPNNTMTDEEGELPQPVTVKNTQSQTASDGIIDEEDSDNQAADTDDQGADAAQPAAQEESPQEIAPEYAAPLIDHMLEKLASSQLLPEPAAVVKPQAIAQAQTVSAPKQAMQKIVRKMVQRPPLAPAQTQMLSKMAQGFMKSMCADLGNAPSNDPTQLAHQRYMTKLWNNLKHTMNSENNVLALSADIDTRATLVMTINKQGKLLEAALRHPHKTADISKMESMLLANAQKVGLFPPLPASFKKDEVTFVMPIHLRAQAGVHSGYRLQVER